MVGKFFAVRADHPEILDRLSALDPTNPFCTPGYFRAVQARGVDTWVAGLEEGEEWLSAGGVFLKRGRLNRVAEIASLPAAASDKEYWAGLRCFCSRHGITRIQGDSFASPALTVPPLRNEVARSIRYEHVVDLVGPDLSGGMSKKHLQRFRKAKASGLTLRRSVEESACLEHVRVVDASLYRRRERGENVEAGPDADGCHRYLRTRCGELFQALLGETVLSSALVLLSPDGAYYQTSGSTPEGMALGASDFLIHSIAEALKDQGVKIFNLGGAPPGSSLEEFKKRFGGRVVESVAVRLDVGRVWRKTLTSMVKLARAGRPAFATKLHRLVSCWYQVPWCVPAWGWPEFATTTKCLLTGAVRTGPWPQRVIDILKTRLNRSFAIPVGRGRDAITLALRALEIQTGDEVILPSYVCYSVVEAVLQSGARPVFADVDDTLHLTHQSVESVITGRTRCVIVPHLFGNTAPIEEIEGLLRPRGIALIDDAAQALGARRRGRPAGSFGEFGVVCGGPGKPLAAAGGGVLLMNDAGLYQNALRASRPVENSAVILRRVLRFWFWRRFRRYTLVIYKIVERLRGEPEDKRLGLQGVSNLEAGLLIQQIEKLESTRQERVQNALRLLTLLEPFGWRTVSNLGPESNPVKLVFLLPKSGPAMETVIDVLGAAGMECQAGYSPCHWMAGGRNGPKLPNTESLYDRVLCIPIERPLRSDRRLIRLVETWANAVRPDLSRN